MLKSKHIPKELTIETLRRARWAIAGGEEEFVCCAISRFSRCHFGPERSAIEEVLQSEGIRTDGAGFNPDFCPQRFVAEFPPSDFSYADLLVNRRTFARKNRLKFLDMLIEAVEKQNKESP